ncbi:MAG: zinc ribbon domain-containing protein [Candidatus Schekmanbacteria bacterium]|nr:zinc ribbon domain-containing protein [Candidatus Schekmanbacteria bacterium]
MPLFEYKCDSCGAVFEKLVFGAESENGCPRCGEGQVTKLYSVFATSSAEKSGEAALESGPCGSCGAAQRGMCEYMS